MDNIVIQNINKRETDRQLEIQKKKNEMKLIHAEHEQYDYFTEVFQEKTKQLNNWLLSSTSSDDLGRHFDHIWKELHLLQKFVADSLIFLRDYDIKICQKSIQELETKTRKLELELIPKKKFGFKNKKIAKPNLKIKNDQVDNIKHETIKYDFNGFRDTSNSKLILDQQDLLGKDISLQNLNKCFVELKGNPSTLHMTNLRDCVVLSGPVSTSVFAENCADNKFVIACQQLRLHSSTKCHVYLHVTSKAIIEDCHDIKVTEYNYNYKGLAEDYLTSKLDKTINNWSKIEDFNWLVMDKQSPNWSLLDHENIINNWDEIDL